jgi:hypothetical protein
MRHFRSLFAIAALAAICAPALASLTYSTAAGNARLTAGLITTSTAAGASLDGQSTFGLLVIGDSSLSTSCTGAHVLATVTLQKPSFSVASKVATLLGVPLSATPSANGTAALANLCDSGNNPVGTGLTVGTSASDIIVSTTSLTTSVPVSVTSGTITTQ